MKDGITLIHALLEGDLGRISGTRCVSPEHFTVDQSLANYENGK